MTFSHFCSNIIIRSLWSFCGFWAKNCGKRFLLPSIKIKLNVLKKFAENITVYSANALNFPSKFS